MFYEVLDSKDGEYAHLEIKVFVRDTEAGVLPYPFDTNRFLLTWQRNLSGEMAAEWYGGTVKIESDNPRRFYEVMGGVRKLLNPFKEDGSIPSPEDVVARLEKLGSVQVTYDGRLSEYVLPSEVQDPEASAWYDKPLGDENACAVNVIARTPEEAKAKAIGAFADLIGGSRYQAERNTLRLKTWLEAGQPMEQSSFGMPGDPRPAQEIIAIGES